MNNETLQSPPEESKNSGQEVYQQLGQEVAPETTPAPVIKPEVAKTEADHSQTEVEKSHEHQIFQHIQDKFKEARGWTYSALINGGVAAVATGVPALVDVTHSPTWLKVVGITASAYGS